MNNALCAKPNDVILLLTRITLGFGNVCNNVTMLMFLIHIFVFVSRQSV